MDSNGDSSVVNNKGDMIYKDPSVVNNEKIKDLRVYMLDGRKLSHIGNLGEKLNVDEILKNKLKETQNSMVPCALTSGYRNSNNYNEVGLIIFAWRI